MKSLLETSDIIDKSSKNMSEAFNEKRTTVLLYYDYRLINWLVLIV